MVDATVVGRDIVCVEEDAFLDCVVLVVCAVSVGKAVHTPLEAGDGSRDLDAAGEEVGKSGEESE